MLNGLSSGDLTAEGSAPKLTHVVGRIDFPAAVGFRTACIFKASKEIKTLEQVC